MEWRAWGVVFLKLEDVADGVYSDFMRRFDAYLEVELLLESSGVSKMNAQ